MARILLILALSTVALAQSKGSNPQSTTKGSTQTAAPTPKTDQTPPAATPENQPVITIHGLCPSRPGELAPAQSSASCTTSITRKEFESLLTSLSAAGRPVPPQVHRQVAQSYVELLTFVNAAKKAGVEKDPDYQEALRVQQMLVLSQFYRRRMEDEARKISDADIQAYYNQNLPKFEQVKLQRLFIPKKNPTTPAPNEEFAKKAQQLANDLHDRAAKNEDMAKLQKEAYDALGITNTPPPVDLPPERRNMIAPAEVEEVFALKPGAISKVEDEPAAFIVYKLVSKEATPLEQAKTEISQDLFQQKMKADTEALTSSVHADLDDQYFGVAAPPRPSEFQPMPAGPPAKSPSASTPPKP